jgi:S-DNA-T family DNA segregation ATPase FtsK/SpoIIIE
MQLVVRTPDRQWDLSVPGWRTTTPGMLADRLGIEPGSQALVDGRGLPIESPIGTLPIHMGSIIEFGPAPAAPPVPVVDLCIVAGPDSGSRLPLPPGDYAVGDSDDANIVIADAGLAAVELLLRVDGTGVVEVHPVPSLTDVAIDGTRLAGRATLETGAILTVGPSGMIVRPHRSDDRAVLEHPRRRGTIPFNRPPRTLGAIRMPAVHVPGAQPAPGRPQRFRWATALAPMAAGIAMAFLFSPFMLLFAVLSPVMVTANWVEDRSRLRRERREREHELNTGLERLQLELTAAAVLDRTRLLAAHPDLAETARRARAGSEHLWERRPHHDDFLRLLVGYGTIPWEPRLDIPSSGIAPEAEEPLSLTDHLLMGPITVDVGTGRVVGIGGNRTDTVDVATALVLQAAIHHGPSDLRIAVATEPGRRREWEWTKWLPHSVIDRSAEQRFLAADPEEVANLFRLLSERPEAARLGAPAERQPATLLVVDLDGLADEDHAPIRDVLAGMGSPVAGIVLGDQLPSSCTAVIEATPERTRVRLPSEDRRVDARVALRAGREIAEQTAAALARFEDPDLRQSGGDLPTASRLAALLDLEEVTPSRVLARWRSQPDGSLAAPVGETEAGPLVLDLVADGPHGLVAGTTGSGKSELLRTMVASMAASVDPTGLNFVLIDYKGGSAFDACAELPHTVGLVTDLDAHLGERALVSLEAELRYREGCLRRVGASDIAEYRELSDVPLPRLVVIIDEFAALAKELPAFVASLVDIAQRGRSLGVHMLLATQRPSGVVSENIRANTNLRIALRVQDGADSTDVIGDNRAASIGRRLPGRAFLRLGPAETFPFQAALVTGSGREVIAAGIRAFRFGFEPRGAATPTAASGPTDLETLVVAIQDAARSAGIPPARRPWLEPLPSVLAPGTVAPLAMDEGIGVTIGLLDDPYRQAQVPFSWRGDRGNLLIFGAAGAGTSTALLGIATRLASVYSPDRVHLYGIDYDGQGLLDLRPLPHTGAMVAAEDSERQQRLIRLLRGEIEQRRRHAGSAGTLRDLPAIVLLIDEYAGLRAAFDEAGDHRHLDALHRIIADGPGLGIYTIATAKRASAFPSSVASVVAEKLIMNLADANEMSGFGLYGSSVPAFVPGRAINLSTGHEIQLDLPLPVETIGGPAPRRHPATVEVLAPEVKLSEIVDEARLTDQLWHLPIGIGDSNLEVVGWELGEGDGALVAGSSRSGRSTCLVGIAATVARHRPDVGILAFTPRPSPVHDLPELTVCDEDPGPVLAELPTDRQYLVLIDDADFIADSAGALQRFLAGRPRHVRVIAAGRADVLRTTYGHWTQEVRRARTGLILDPSPLTDGDLFGVQLPRLKGPRLPTGRGYLISGGDVELTQAAIA